MAVVSTTSLAASAQAARLALFDLPFFFQDLHEVTAMQQSGLGEALLDSAGGGGGLVGLAYWNAGMSQLFGTRGISEAGQLKGARLYTTVSPFAEPAIIALGATVVRGDVGNVQDAIESGTIDLVEAPATFVARELVPLGPAHYSTANFRPVAFVVVANEEFWRSQRLRVQWLLATRSREIAKKVTADAEERAQRAASALSKTFQLTTVTQSQLGALREAAAPAWRQVDALESGDFLRVALATRQALKQKSPQPPKQGSQGKTSDQSILVAFATDRQDDGAAASDPSFRFAGARGALTFGHAEVALSSSRQFGDRSANSIWLSAVSESEEEAQFVEAMKAELDTRPRREILLYVHGFRTTFASALQDAAQIAADTKFRGVAVAFSWPSDGTLLRYSHDEEEIRGSRDTFIRLIKALSATGAAKIHVVAHSMGARLLTDSLEWLVAQPTDRRPELYHLILAAPDVHVTLFRRAVHGMTAMARTTSLYASQWDEALNCSLLWHGARRAGQGGPDLTVVEKIQTIDVSDLEERWISVPCTSLGHSYVSQNHAVLADLYDLLAHDTAPEDRPRLHREESKQGLTYWSMK